MGAECAGNDVLLGRDLNRTTCLEICREVPDCVYVTVGIGKKQGMCFWEENDCTEYERDHYDVYQVYRGGEEEADSSIEATCSRSNNKDAERDAARHNMPAENGAKGAGPPLPPEPVLAHTPDGSVDLLITEEGWGLSSANWM